MKWLEDGVVGGIERQGRWLFHRRSGIGIVLLPFFALALWQPGFPAASLSPNGLDALAVAGLLVSLAGLLLRAFTVATVPEHTSRRSTRELAAQTLNTRGMYSLVRHPLYLANAVVATGFALAVGSLWFMAVFQLAHALYIERIMACEDRFVAQEHPEQWHAWAARTPAIWPRHLQWTPPELGWSVRTILRREYNSVCLATTAFFVLQLGRGTLAADGSPLAWIRQAHLWDGIFVFGLMVLLVLRTLKRHTRLLHVAGR